MLQKVIDMIDITMHEKTMSENGLFAIKIESRGIVNHMIRNVILIANRPYNTFRVSFLLCILGTVFFLD